MAKSGRKSGSGARRVYPLELKEEAVQMLLDGHSAGSVCERLGLSGTYLLYRLLLELIRVNATRQ